MTSLDLPATHAPAVHAPSAPEAVGTFAWRAVAFVRRPSAHAEVAHLPMQAVLTRLGLMVPLTLLACMVVGGVLQGAYGLLGLAPEYQFAETIAAMRQDTSALCVGLLLLGAIVPLVEETVFRLWLRPTRWRLILCWSLMALLLGFLLQDQAGMRGWWPLTGVVHVALVTWRRTAMQAAVTPGALGFDRRVHLSTVLFALAHTGNWAGEPALLLALLTVPQLLAGYVLAYVRLRLGFWAAVATHGLYNSTLLLLVAALPD